MTDAVAGSPGARIAHMGTNQAPGRRSAAADAYDDQKTDPVAPGKLTLTAGRYGAEPVVTAQPAAGEDVGPRDKLWYGVVQNDAVDASWVDKAKKLGVGSIKVRIKHTDKLVKDDPMYELIVGCKKAGLEVIVLMNNESVDTDYVNPDLNKTTAKARELVDKLGKLADGWQVWNEPESIEPDRDMTAASLMQVLAAVYPIFQQTGKPVIAAPEWTTGKGDTFRGNMASWWKENRSRFPEVKKSLPFDDIAVNAYFQDGWDPEGLIGDTMAGISENFGADMKVFVTEFGYQAEDAAGQRDQVTFIEQISRAFARHENVDRMFYYSLKDYPSAESGAAMGLHDQDGAAKPAASHWGIDNAATAHDARAAAAIPPRGSRPDLAPEFLAHVERLGGHAGEADLDFKWKEWFPFFTATAQSGAPPLTGVPVTPPRGSRPDLEAQFSTHVQAIGGAADEADLEAKWSEWYPAYQSNRQA
jgi:hypothetical protein